MVLLLLGSLELLDQFAFPAIVEQPSVQVGGEHGRQLSIVFVVRVFAVSAPLISCI